MGPVRQQDLHLGDAGGKGTTPQTYPLPSTPTLPLLTLPHMCPCREMLQHVADLDPVLQQDLHQVFVFTASPPPPHHHLSLICEGRWGITDDSATSFLQFSLFSTALWDLANSRPVHVKPVEAEPLPKASLSNQIPLTPSLSVFPQRTVDGAGC